MIIKDIKQLLTTFLVILSLNITLDAQLDSRINMPSYDDKPIHFGYLLGINSSSFKITHSDNFINSDTLTSLKAVGNTGFEVGFIFNMRLGEHFDLRALPKVSFYERSIYYYFKSTETPVIADFQSSIIEIPFLVKYKSQRRKNLRMYMVSGLKTGFEVGAKKRQKRNDQVATKAFNLSLEYGLGLDLYYPLFKLSPELRFSLGLLDILKKTDNIYSHPIDGMKAYNLSLAIMFE